LLSESQHVYNTAMNDPSRLSHRISILRLEYPFLEQLDKRFPSGEVYLVGGAVRDILVDKETKDYDFLVRGISAALLGPFLSQHGKVNLVGKTFGVYKFVPNNRREMNEEALDIALPRTEESFAKQGGYRDFTVQSNPDLPIEEDLKRRDFTINAIAVNMKTGLIVDPFGGASDLASGQIKAVGEATTRFAEDYSRLLRGLRLACQFHFQFDDKTWEAILSLIGQINAKREDGSYIVPRETVAKEFIKSLVCDPVRTLDLWDESGAFSALIPELLTMKGCPQPPQYHSEGDVWMHTRLALSTMVSERFQEEFQSTYDAELALAVLLHDVAKPATLKTPERDGVDRIRFDNHAPVGGQMADKIVQRMKLSTLPKGSRYHINGEALVWLIDKHLLLVQGEVDKMRASTIEKHFLNPKVPGQKLLQLIFCDGSATLPASGAPQLVSYKKVRERIKQIDAVTVKKGELFCPPLLSGREVMHFLGIPAGPEVGRLLALLREEQLSVRIGTHEEAILFLKQQRAFS